MFDLIVNAISNPYVLSLITVSVWNALNDPTTEGILIKEYWTLSEAAKETGIGRDNILRCIKGKNRHAGGYLWFYK